MDNHNQTCKDKQGRFNNDKSYEQQLKPSWLGHSGFKPQQNRPSKDNVNTLKIDEGDNHEDLDVVKVGNGRYKANLHVPPYYFGLINGKQGSTRGKIERETNTVVNIPRQGQEGNITIFGSKAEGVSTARKMINRIVISSRVSRKPTHFISIPMNNPDIIKRFEEFKTSVLNECAESNGLEEILFKNPVKLHITIGVLFLSDDEELLQASELLNEAKTKVLTPLLEGHLPLNIRLKGISYMDDVPTAINVMYGILQEEGNSKGLIQKLADGLVDYFNKAGYMRKERDHVTLHVTLLNSKFRNKAKNENATDTERPKRREPRIPFDGTDILKKYSEYDFGVSELQEIRLTNVDSLSPDEYYETYKIVSV